MNKAIYASVVVSLFLYSTAYADASSQAVAERKKISPQISNAQAEEETVDCFYEYNKSTKLCRDSEKKGGEKGSRLKQGSH